MSRRQFVELAAASGLSGALGEAGEAAPAEAAPAALEDVVINASAPRASPTRGFDALVEEVRAARRGGWHVLGIPVATTEHFPAASDNLVRLYGYADRLRGEVEIIRSAAGMARVRAEGRLGLLLAFQGMQMIENDLDLLQGFAALGVHVMQLTSGWKNLNGDGAFERSDLKLTALGAKAVQALNDAGIVIDLSRAGRRSSLDAMERSRHPVIFSRCNAASVHPHAMNVTDEQIDACAASGGVIGISAFPALLSASPAPEVGDVLRHLDHVARRAGIDHVGLGLDFDDRRVTRFPSDPLPLPPYRYPAGLARLEDLPAFRERLRAAGYSEDDVRKLLGGNFARVLGQVWPAAA